MTDLSVVVISISVIVLCWAVVRINQRLDKVLRNRKLIKDLDRSEAKAAPPPVGTHVDA